MAISLFMQLLGLYFALVLGVSALAKLENPAFFMGTLRRQRIFPARGILFIAWAAIGVEIAVPVFLITGLLPLVSSVTIVFLFLGFLILEIALLKTKRTNNCGCYGVVNPQKVDVSSILSLIIYNMLAMLNFWLTFKYRSVGYGVSSRYPLILIFFGMCLWLLLRRLNIVLIKDSKTRIRKEMIG
ncbi:MAG: hypothetical protein PHQ40_20800 [Anaerolineaceae bacterium]|nr:hypothetical protein [Anaerolineaceae bacterium]